MGVHSKTPAIKVGQPLNPKVEDEKHSRPSEAHPNIPAGAWTLAGFCLASYVITVVFAFGNAVFTQIQYLALSPAHTLTILRTLSEATTLLLTALIASATEKTFWLLVSRIDGISLPDFLALQLNTGIWGWLKHVFRRRFRARGWGSLRISLALAVPVLAVVLLSDVTIYLLFDQKSLYPISAGVGTFDASYAEAYGDITAIYMSSDTWRLLQLNQWSYPSIPVVSCKPSSSESDCGSSYFLHGGIWLVAPWPTKNTSFPTADGYVMNQVRGVQLDFQPLDSNFQFDPEHDCAIAGQNNLVIGLCFSQGSTPHVVNTKLTSCPYSALCLSDLTWVSSPGWVTSMAVYTRRANVNLARYNLTTLSIDSLSPATPVATSARDLLQLYNTTFQPRNEVGYSSNLVAIEFVNLLSTYLNTAQVGGNVTINQASGVFYNLLALPLLYFQPTYMSPWSAIDKYNTDGTAQGYPLDQGLYTTASFARPHYSLLVGRWSVWLYTLGTGLLLLLCLLVLGPATFFPSRYRREIRNTTSWPVLDVVAHCQPQSEADPAEQAEEPWDLVAAIRAVKSNMTTPGSKQNRELNTRKFRIVARAVNDRSGVDGAARRDVENQQVDELTGRYIFMPDANLEGQDGGEAEREREIPSHGAVEERQVEERKEDGPGQAPTGNDHDEPILEEDHHDHHDQQRQRSHENLEEPDEGRRETS